MEEGDKNSGMLIKNVEIFDNNELYMNKNAEKSKENLESSNTATSRSIGNSPTKNINDKGDVCSNYFKLLFLNLKDIVKNALSMFLRFFEPY